MENSLYKTYVEEYWDMVEDQYNITFEEFKGACISPFRFIKQSMASGVLKNIRIKYFGLFQVSARRVKFSKINLEKNFERKVISEEHYNKRKKVLDSYVPPVLFHEDEADIIGNFSYEGRTYKKIINK